MIAQVVTEWEYRPQLVLLCMQRKKLSKIFRSQAPAAFGLVSFLLMEGIDARNARKHLLVFACAAPFAAVITFIILQSIGSESISSSESSTGILMLFSAGTFLFVATVHVLPELTNHGKTSMDYTLVVDAQSPATAGHSHSGICCSFFHFFFRASHTRNKH
ncbi:hypothetical protein ANCCAN_18132 [Ancylostoma caninum]|uniref:Uncharacterized protein n=1 Tax=Ancylostoma caninum TaxID=29170 RepID=A0A368G092_ANCCA|nr:hypothetical protein ANCCAN_18132 [Ancylostoma caninum]